MDASRLLRAFVMGGVIFASGCTQLPLGLPSPTHTSKPPTNEFAGLQNFGQVTDQIYRGSQPTEAGYAHLVKIDKVKSILSLRRGVNRDVADLKLANVTTAKCHQVSLKEWNPGEDDLQRLASAVKTLKVLSDNPKTRPVYVHCQAGVNRTGFVVATYRMVYQGWTPEEAVREMRMYRFYRIYYRDEWFLKNLDVGKFRKVIAQVEPHVPGETILRLPPLPLPMPLKTKPEAKLKADN